MLFANEGGGIGGLLPGAATIPAHCAPRVADKNSAKAAYSDPASTAVAPGRNRGERRSNSPVAAACTKG